MSVSSPETWTSVFLLSENDGSTSTWRASPLPWSPLHCQVFKPIHTNHPLASREGFSQFCVAQRSLYDVLRAWKGLVRLGVLIWLQYATPLLGAIKSFTLNL